MHTHRHTSSRLIALSLLLGLGQFACSDEPEPQNPAPVSNKDMSMQEDMGVNMMLDGFYKEEDLNTGYMIPDMPPPPPCDETKEDIPDLLGYDANCDGIDGDLKQSVFVAPYGEDTFEGTRIKPMKTIAAAIAKVQADDTKSWVLVQNGKYTEPIVLQEGVNMAGGYKIGWTRTGGSYSKVVAGNPTVVAENITQKTYFIGFELRPSEQLEFGQTVRTIVLKKSPGVILQRVFAFGGTAGSGADGMEGEEGKAGRRGGNGGKGVTDSGGLCSKNSRPRIGAAATAVCGGGAGGQGGLSEKGDRRGLAGTSGEPSQEGEKSGNPGGGGGYQTLGGNGGDGISGVIGTAGNGALPQGSFVDGTWVGNDGEVGSVGTYGGGGSGAGGGGGGDKGCDSYGGAGGGGGSGGCGGEGGLGGKHGGASVVLYLEESDVVIEDCRFVIGQGGNGGRGGAGGRGGSGGEGGNGGARKDDSGGGGQGGTGGKGGTGGPGGGGAGGPALGIYSDVALSQEPVRLIFIEGAAGFGGSGLGQNGQGSEGLHRSVQVGPIMLDEGSQ